MEVQQPFISRARVSFQAVVPSHAILGLLNRRGLLSTLVSPALLPYASGAKAGPAPSPPALPPRPEENDPAFWDQSIDANVEVVRELAAHASMSNLTPTPNHSLYKLTYAGGCRGACEGASKSARRAWKRAENAKNVNWRDQSKEIIENKWVSLFLD